VKGPAESPAIDPNLIAGTSQLEPTFRDPAGRLFLTPTHALRQIRPAASEATLAFLDSPLRAALEKSGDLISTQVATPAVHPRMVPGELWLAHPRIDPITYPWEWTPAQWRAAADLTLRIAGLAIRDGWTLKDATPLNILFIGPRPVLVDVLSFERRDPQSTVWLAYGQFVRTFLLPLVAAKYLSWPLSATISARDGYEPAEIYKALGPVQRLRPSLFDVVTLATKLERREPGRPGPDRTRLDRSGPKPQPSRKSPPVTRDPELAAHILLKRMARLGRQIVKTASSQGRTQWSEYTQIATHYKPEDVAAKQEFVRNMLLRCGPARVLDVGANTGAYSLMAAEAGASVVAIDADAAAIEVLGQAAAKQKLPITTLVANIARPTPAAGWRNREHLSLLDRLTGKFDLVLMLAVIHHFILREQLPLPHIAELCASLTNRWLVLEWVPPSDPMFQEWLRGRDDLYGHLSEDDLERAFSPFFIFADRSPLSNGRVLFLLERIPGAATASTAGSAHTGRNSEAHPA
jgi:SAM-dependent methyltransferase